jgi:PQQ-like domain
MTALEQLKAILDNHYETEDGDEYQVERKQGLSDEQIDNLSKYPISNTSEFDDFVVEGNTRYYVAVENSFNANLCSFDLRARKVQWKAALGFDLNSNHYSLPVMGTDKVFIKNGTGSLLAVDKKTGNVAWQKNGPNNTDPVYSEGLVFTADENKGVLAYNESDGSMKWQRESGYHKF